MRAEIQRRKQIALGNDIIKACTTFEDFVSFTTPNYKFGWFNKAICRKLQKFYDDCVIAAELGRQGPRLMLFAPPRHGKSELVSRKFPAYVFGRNPDLSIISTAYSDDLAGRMNRDVQRLIDEDLYHMVFPDTFLSGSNVRNAAKGNWLRNTDLFEIVGHKGSYRSAGVGSGITGMGANILIIDDPVKDAEQAASVTIQTKIWEWYTSTFYTRQSPGAGILLIMTRWNLSDLAGKLLEAQKSGDGDTWEVCSFPAIFEEDESGNAPPRHEDDHRQIGEALHPERYNREMLDAYKAATGSYAWASLYQQQPVPREGALFKRAWFEGRTVGVAPSDCIVWRHWDLAASLKKQGQTNQAWTAGVKMGYSPSLKKYFVIHVIRLQAEGHEVRQTLFQTAEIDGKTVKISIGHDPGQAGKFQTQDYINHLAGYSAYGLIESGEKFARAEPFSAQCEAGNVYLVKGDWNMPYLDELCVFPSAAAKDQVDASSGAFSRLADAPKQTFNLPIVITRKRSFP